MRLAASPKTRIRIGMAMIAITTRMIRAMTAIPTGFTTFGANEGRREKPGGLMLTENRWAGARG